MIGSSTSFSGYYALAAPARPAGRLLDNAGATLQTLDDGASSVARIKAALTSLRDALEAARAQADAVPGDTTLTPVTADVARTQQKPTFVTIAGEPVQTGTIDVPAGTRSVVVGFERTPRAALKVGDAFRSLASTVGALASRVGADGGFTADVSALLRSGDLATAVKAPDAATIDAALARIDGVLAKTDGLRAALGARAAAAARVDLSGLLLGAVTADTGAPAGGDTSTQS